MHAQGKAQQRHEKTLHFSFDLGQRDSLQQSKREKQNSWEEKESYFQSDHIIRFTCSLIKRKKSQGIYKQNRMAHSNKKKCLTDTVPEKELRADLLDKTL